MKNIGFAFNPTKSEAVELRDRAMAWCKDHGAKPWSAEAQDTDALVRGLAVAEALIVLGGDGTFLRATRALKGERAGFISFAQRKYGYSKEVMEEAYKYLVDALAQDGFVEDASLQAAIDEAKSLAKITKQIPQSDVVDYSFLRVAVKK